MLKTIFLESSEHNRSRLYNWLTYVYISATESVRPFLSVVEPRGNGNRNSRPVSMITYDVVVTSYRNLNPEPGQRATRCAVHSRVLASIFETCHLCR